MSKLLEVFVLILICIGLMIIIDAYQNRKKRGKKKIFLVSPVRNAPPEVMTKVEKYVEKLEEEGRKVFWPKRDNPYQETDLIGIDICDMNFEKIFECSEVHIWLTKDSTGSIFDSGGVYMLVRILKQEKKIVFANKEEFADVIKKPEKSFPKVLDFLEKATK